MLIQPQNICSVQFELCFFRDIFRNHIFEHSIGIFMSKRDKFIYPKYYEHLAYALAHKIRFVGFSLFQKHYGQKQEGKIGPIFPMIAKVHNTFEFLLYQRYVTFKRECLLLFNGCFRFVKTANFAFKNLIHWVKTFVNVDSTPKHLFCSVQALFFRDIRNYIFEHSSKLKDWFCMLKFCPRRGFVS